MMRSIQRLLYFLSAVFLFTSCNKKEWDEYYGRPDDLAPPIYQQLQAKGNFNTLLAVIDKSGYKDILGKAGAWTFFAPTDEAFAKYFQENNISGIDALSKEDARKIALFGLVYNPYRKDQLSFYQTSTGPDTNASYRRKTAYYDFVYTENGKKVVDNSRNGSTFISNENNNKYIPYFIQSYLDHQDLSNDDFKAFYPDRTFSGFNVAGANVIEADVPAENGVIHVVDKVITPLQNVDQYLSGKPQYSKFKALLDKYVLYIENEELTKRYNVLTGSADPVFLKTYSTLLPFSPNVEGYTAVTHTDGQNSSWSVAVPTDSKLTEYTNEILEYYHSFDDAPPSVLLYFLSSHMWRSTVWPSKMAGTANALNEVPTFTKGDVVESKMLSNANFYGINGVHKANVFRSVFGHSYLNPDYTLMTRALSGTDVFDAVTAPTVKVTMLLISNADMANAGYEFNESNSSWGWNRPGFQTDYTATALNRVNRFVQNSVLLTPEGEFDNLSGEGITETYNGEYVKFKNNKIFASGNVAEGTEVTVTSTKTSVNGRVYYTNGFLKFAEDNVNLGWSLEKLATSTDANVKSKFSYFFDYLKGSDLWDDTKKEILGLEAGALYTLFVPTNAAISDAVKAGTLPGNTTTGVPNFNKNTMSNTHKDNVEKLIEYSIIVKATVAADGKKANKYPTLLKDAGGDSRILTISYPGGNQPQNMTISDDTSSPVHATINYSFSNNLSNRALIHSINQVLKF